MSLFDRVGSRLKQNLFDAADKMEAEVLEVLLTIPELNVPYEALHKAEPGKGAYIHRDHMEGSYNLAKTDFTFYTERGPILIDVKNVPTMGQRNTRINVDTHEKKMVNWVPQDAKVVDKYKELAKLTGAVGVWFVFVHGDEMYLTCADNCEHWDGRHPQSGEVIWKTGPCYQYYLEDVQPGKIPLKGIERIK